MVPVRDLSIPDPVPHLLTPLFRCQLRGPPRLRSEIALLGVALDLGLKRLHATELDSRDGGRSMHRLVPLHPSPALEVH